MIQLALLSFTLGAALAGRFQFLILSVATFLGLVAIGLYAHAAALSAAGILAAGAVFAICLQSGYLTGTLIYDRYQRAAKAPVPVRATRRPR